MASYNDRGSPHHHPGQEIGEEHYRVIDYQAALEKPPGIGIGLTREAAPTALIMSKTANVVPTDGWKGHSRTTIWVTDILYGYL